MIFCGALWLQEPCCLLATTPEGVEAAVESAAPAKDQAQGYRLTPHVAAYYKTAAL
ncbi:MAG: hypothetical protein R3E95_02700 [Thiolinea sp.]